MRKHIRLVDNFLMIPILAFLQKTKIRQYNRSSQWRLPGNDLFYSFCQEAEFIRDVRTLKKFKEHLIGCLSDCCNHFVHNFSYRTHQSFVRNTGNAGK